METSKRKHERTDYYFDACAMIGRWHRSPLHFHAVEELLIHMREFHIRCTLVFHSISRLHDFRRGNEALDREIVGRTELVPCYAVIPFTTGEMPAPAEWDKRLHAGAFAWRIFPRSHNFMLTGRGADNLFSYAAEHQLPVFVDIDEIEYSDLWNLCREHPQLRLIIGNAGTDALFGVFREFRRLYEFLQEFECVSLETSFLIGFRGIEDICARYGAGRLIFGSRMPFLEPGSSIARLQYAEITPEERNRIAHGNMENMLAGVST